jgi:hypothetical protein
VFGSIFPLLRAVIIYRIDSGVVGYENKFLISTTDNGSSRVPKIIFCKSRKGRLSGVAIIFES